jgi:hypothetical protein
MMIVSGSYNVTVPIARRNEYRLIALQCTTRGGTQLSGKCNVMTPVSPEEKGLQHIPLEQVPLLKVHDLLIVIYSSLLAIWIIYLAITMHTYGVCSFAAPLQLAVTIAIAFKFSSIVVSSITLKAVSQNGSSDTLIVEGVLRNLSTATLLFVVMVMACGFSLTNFQSSGLETVQEMICHVLVFIVYVGFQIAASICNAGDGECLSLDYGSFLSMGVFLLSILLIMNKSIARISAECNVSVWNENTALAYSKFRLAMTLRVSVFIFLLLPIVIRVLIISLLGWNYQWITTVTDEGMILVGSFVFLTLSPTKSPKIVTLGKYINDANTIEMVPMLRNNSSGSAGEETALVVGGDGVREGDGERRRLHVVVL